MVCPRARSTPISPGASFGAVFFAFLPFVLLSAGLSPQATWRVGSATLGFLFATMAAIRFRQFREAGPAISVQESTTFLVVGVLILLLIANSIYLTTAWPYLLGVVGTLGLGASQFIRLLLELRR